MFDRYTPVNLWRSVKNPSLLLGELRRINIQINKRLYVSHERGMDVMAADWDNLLILDACRFDVFAENYSLPGDLDQIDTGASDSKEYMARQFDGKHHDTVYITSNPYAVGLDPDTFHSIINLFKTEWDEDLETVPPEAVTDAALEAATMYPNKRLIVHYMQPHFPFIGEFGRTLDTGNLSGKIVDEAMSENRPSIWTLLQKRQTSVSAREVTNAYHENFGVVEPEIRRFWEQQSGKTVVTADHGNLIGDRLAPLFQKAYGHPRGVAHPALRSVPWHELPYSSRKSVWPDEPSTVEEVDRDTVTDRLQSLGYKA